MGGDVGAELQDQIKKMEEQGKIDKLNVKVGDFKKKKEKVMEQTYM